MPRQTQSVLKEEAQILAETQGFTGQTFDRQTARAGTIMIDGTVYFMMVPLRAGTTVTNVGLNVFTAGATVSLSKVGIYSVSGVSVTRLGLSADQGTAWQSSTATMIALTSPVSISTTGGYYLAVVAKAATLPTLTAGSQIIALRIGGTQELPYAALAGQTDLPTSGTVTSTGAIPYWLAWS